MLLPTYLVRDAGADKTGGQVFTRDALTSLVFQLKRFRTAQGSMFDRTAAISVLTGRVGAASGRVLVRVVHSDPRDFEAVLAASEARRPAATGVLTSYTRSTLKA